MCIYTDIQRTLDTYNRKRNRQRLNYNSQSARIIGAGQFKTGNLNLTAQIAPKLDANSLSAGKLVNVGYFAVLKRNIHPGIDLEIKEDSKLVATGHVTTNNMIRLMMA